MTTPESIALAALRRLLTSRAPANKPATWESDDDHVYELFHEPDGETLYGLVASCLAEEDAALIATAFNALPALLNRLAAATEMAEAVRRFLDRCRALNEPWPAHLQGLLDVYDRAIAGQQRQEGT